MDVGKMGYGPATERLVMMLKELSIRTNNGDSDGLECAAREIACVVVDHIKDTHEAFETQCDTLDIHTVVPAELEDAFESISEAYRRQVDLVDEHRIALAVERKEWNEDRKALESRISELEAEVTHYKRILDQRDAKRVEVTTDDATGIQVTRTTSGVL